MTGIVSHHGSWMVNRSDGVVAAVFIAGEQVWVGTDFTPVLGSKRLGRALRAG